MKGVIKIIRGGRQMSCRIPNDHDEYLWSLNKALATLPDIQEVRAVWGWNDGTTFTEQRTNRIEGEVREWMRTH